VTKTQSAGPISCLEHRATRVLHCAIVTRAAVLMFPLLLQNVISVQMRLRRLRGAWFSRLLRHPARRRSGSILSPGTHTGSYRISNRTVGDRAFAAFGPTLWNGLPHDVTDCVSLTSFCRKLKTFSVFYTISVTTFFSGP